MINIEAYLSNFYKGSKEQSLDAMHFFINKYNNFEENMNFIHIAGTNGKGSCAEIISNILVCQGFKVGKFLSPHLIKYNERISINGIDITDEEMGNIIEELEPLIEEYKIKNGVEVTFFELITIMALLYFYRNNVDFVVLETGLGGLYDCTNIITKPLVSIITSIGYDHMHILGYTLTEIAYQKAGIIKENSNTVIFSQTDEIDNVFIRECKEKNNKLYILKDNDISNYSLDKDFQYFDFKDMKDLKINLKGKIQINNVSLCIQSINIINEFGYNISKDAILKGISTVVHRGRMEKLSDNPLIIFDGAHNEPAVKNLQNSVKAYYGELKRIYIVSILKRKDYENMLKLLSEDKNSLFILTSGHDETRYATKDELYEVAIKYKSKDEILLKDIDEAIKYVMDTKSNAVNFFVGSFYTYDFVTSKNKNYANK